MFRALFSRRSSQNSSGYGGSPVPNTSSAIESSPSSSSHGCWKYDVFLSFRGEDIRKNFVDHLYTALDEQNVLTYKDDETLARGDTIRPALMKAIQESRIALIVFSINYADSSWCLDELAFIMKCKEKRGQIAIPIFYDVDPFDVRKQKGQFGKAFSKHMSMNNFKVESWKKALVDASNIAGWDTNLVANRHEAKCIKEIVGSVLDILRPSLISAVDGNELVGMATRLQDLKSRLEIRSGGVRMVGIWGVGGGGKTTLATSLYMQVSTNFNSCCFIEKIREESRQPNGLKKLQEKILSTVYKKEIGVESVDIGKQRMKHMLCNRNVLMVLDDVDDLEQLEALAGRHNWFGDGSRIIITTRDEHVLTTHRVDEVCPVSLLSDGEAIRLFRKHAYHVSNPVEDYDELSLRVIKYVKGLPLALKILGSFLYDKDKNEWMSALDKLRKIPNRKVTDQLKLSYDGLEHDEKEMFLDIVCFFRKKSQDGVIKILDACGFHSSIGMKVLEQKALITISSDGIIDMHDLVQEMGHHIVRGEHPYNPEKHTRVWSNEDIEDICAGNAAMENNKIEALQYRISYRSPAKGLMTLISNLKKLRFLNVYFHDRYLRAYGFGGFNYTFNEVATFLSNDLKYIDFEGYPASLFPESFQPRKLVILKLSINLQTELWKGKKYMPCLKVLELVRMKALIRTPDFGGLPSLQKVTISGCGSLQEIHPSIGSHSSLVYIYVCWCPMLTRFPVIVRMEKLKNLKIIWCTALLEFPKIKANMDSLENIELMLPEIEVLPSSVGRYCTNLISLNLYTCSKLKTIEGNFHALKRLKKFELYGLKQLEKFPKDLFHAKCCLEELRWMSGDWNIFPPSPPHLPHLLKKLNLSCCELKDGKLPREIGQLSSLKELQLSSNPFSRLDTSLSQLTQLKLLRLNYCEMLVKLPELPPNLAILEAENCNSLKAIGEEIYSHCKWLCSFSGISYLKQCRNLVGGRRLLQSMLQGNAIEDGQCMSLILRGLEIPKEFEPRLLRGSKYRLQLPRNWFNEYTGFLLCCVLEIHVPHSIKINMGQEKKLVQGGDMMGMGGSQDKHVFWEEDESVDDHDMWEYLRSKSIMLGGSQDEKVLWEEHESVDSQTWVVYVSFGSLKSTDWWDQTSTAVDFSIAPLSSDGYVVDEHESYISGFGARLVSKKNQMNNTTYNSSSEFSYYDGNYKCKFRIHRDSKSELECRLQSFWD